MDSKDRRLKRILVRKRRARIKIISLLFIGILVFLLGNMVYTKATSSDDYELGGYHLGIKNLVSEVVEGQKLKVAEIKLDKRREEIRIEKENLEKIKEEERKKAEEIAKKEEEKNNSNSNSNKVKYFPEGTVGKTAFLTFDDGPSINNTPAILDILKAYNIKGTFFVIGENANKFPELIRRIHEEGHALGNHTYSHDYSIIYSSPDKLMEEVRKTETTFKRILGEDFKTRFFRFPGGSYPDRLKPYVERMINEGYNVYDWNALNGDSEGHDIPGPVLVRRLKETVENKSIVNILMHDTSSKIATVETLPEILDYLIDQGFEFDILR